ncbi:beta-ketoacyl-ACP synthase III [Pseudohongiella spirulinae]|uniref:3-oxoacyl-ACP synthase n=1 Tax=Pseudohongiella spirulinae TaxID=1249552 RepID=A0A0S2KCD9_9GAMM|nr:beta-ketoacyl-ACP synthase III [Pseudohongiella spirulinae]ALO46000.1 3-oxoacyl-ACP synthase [Pseudohongiella spirulinae]
MRLHQASDQVVISGAGLWTPDHVVTNEELVEALNAYADRFNTENALEIEAGRLAPVMKSDASFIEKASGIKQRHVYVKDGILDINRMRPRIVERAEGELSHQAEIALHAARKAMAAANKKAADIDAVIVSCAYTQRAYPAIAIEVQDELGIEGFGFDMLVACSAATFALHRAYEMVRSGTARAVMVINPELVSPQINFCDRDSHFIFGDVATAVIVERGDTANSASVFDILGTQAQTVYSNNIRSNFGYMSRAFDTDPFGVDKLFHQEGRAVFKEVCPMAAEHLSGHLALYGFEPTDVRRWWLHQANINMNQLISKKLLGRMPDNDEAPIVLDRYANTASAGSVIAFSLHHEDLESGDLGMLCSFGAGYSIGSLLLRKR